MLSSYLYNSIRPLLVSHGVQMVPQKANPQRLLAIRQAGIAHAAQRFPFTCWPSGLCAGGLRAIDLGLWAVPHRDPFDRLLAAQARSEDLVLASTAPAFTQFEGVVTLG